MSKYSGACLAAVEAVFHGFRASELYMAHQLFLRYGHEFYRLHEVV